MRRLGWAVVIVLYTMAVALWGFNIGSITYTVVSAQPCEEEGNMSESVLDVAHYHGREMYIIGLEHAISAIELRGSHALEYLKLKAMAERKELADERAQQVQQQPPC